MTDKKLHISEADFKRYIENKMTGSERNAFEKELQKYPFEAEALEGLSTLAPGQFQNDLNELRLRISPAKQNNRFRLMAAAATVLLVISAGVIWMQIKTQNQPVQTAEIKPVKTVEKSTEKYELLKEQPATPEIKENVQINKISPKKKERPTKQVSPPPQKQQPDSNSPETETFDVDGVDSKADNYTIIEDKVALEEDNLRSAKSTKLQNVLKSKQSPTGAAVTAPAPVAAIAPQETISEDMTAHPYNGFKKYKEYLDSTAVLPNHYKKRKVKVQIKFKADSTGNLSDFENINRADSVLFEKACALVKNGPRWVPKIKNGKRVDSEVELRIVFRKR